MADPTPGVAKTVASALAGALTIILVYLFDTYVADSGHQLPNEVVGALQTLIVSAAVFFTPHQIGGQ